MAGSKSRGTASVPHGLIEAILGTVSDAIIATDAAGFISFWNPGAFEYSALPLKKRSGVPSI